MTLVEFTSVATTTGMPTEEPMLRTNVRIEVPSVLRFAGSVANAAVLRGTNTSPSPSPCTTVTDTMVEAGVMLVK